MKVGTDDPDMGLELGGQRFRRGRDGLLDVPDHLAQRLRRSDTPYGVLRYATGWGEGTCDNALKQVLRREE